MQNLDAVQLQGFDTRVDLSAAPWGQGIAKISVHEKYEIPFLLPALSGHHFFTGVWPRPAHAIEYEPHECPGYLIRHSDTSASYHQPTTPYSKVETRVDYTLADTGTIDIVFTTTSHASEYPFGYVGLFWGTVVPEGGQRGFHTLVDDDKRGVRWMYFAASGDATVTDRHTILGPGMEAPEHDSQHPLHYYFAQSGKHFALPIQVGRWRDLAMILEMDDPNVAFTDVLMATAIGGPSWDVYWLLKPGETRRIRCRLTVSRWRGWEHAEERYRDWPGCVDPKFSVSKASHSTLQEFRLPQENEPAKDSGLVLSRRLFEKRGKPLLEKLDLLNTCSVACLGGSSQNAGLDDEWSRDHIWGPYLTFVMDRDTFAGHGPALKAALSEMPDEVDGITWTGYDGPEPRSTRLMETDEFLHLLTRASSKPYADKDWIPFLSESSFLGCRWTETMFDATQGAVFHDPGKRRRSLGLVARGENLIQAGCTHPATLGGSRCVFSGRRSWGAKTSWKNTRTTTPEYGIIYGYDERTGEYLIRHPFAGEFSVSYKGIGHTDPVNWLNLVWFEKQRSIDPKDLELEALKFAVEHAHRTPPEPDPSGVYTGARGWGRRWRRSRAAVECVGARLGT